MKLQLSRLFVKRDDKISTHDAITLLFGNYFVAWNNNAYKILSEFLCFRGMKCLN